MAIKYKGISFPFRFGVRGGVVMSEVNANDFSHTDESIVQALNTRIGERLHNTRTFSEISSSVFEPNSPSLQILLDFQIRECIERVDKRIEISQITIFSKENVTYADISYSVPEVGNSIHNVQVKVGEN